MMAREIFNPNFSLFVQVPEHGTTFQPNANSVVQNDEARGTNHLDFFKFVGRILGKALYDGQLIDAFFTRSFYKHMLGDPLTYEVRSTASWRCLAHINLYSKDYCSVSCHLASKLSLLWDPVTYKVRVAWCSWISIAVVAVSRLPRKCYATL